MTGRDVESEESEKRPCQIRPAHNLEPDERQVCRVCVGAVRADLHAVVNLFKVLPVMLDRMGSNAPQANPTRASERPMPGGDALVLLAGGAGADEARRRKRDADAKTAVTGLANREPEWGADDRDTDPLSVAWELARHEDDWRRIRREPAAVGVAGVLSAAAYLTTNLGWAASRHPEFPDFAADVRRLRGILERVTGTHERPEVCPDAVCLDCEDRLIKRYTDQGLDDEWSCGSCRRVYGPQDYLLARRTFHEGQTAREGQDPVNVQRTVVSLGPAGRVVFLVDPKWLDLPDERVAELEAFIRAADELAARLSA